jgi:flavodoxin
MKSLLILYSYHHNNTEKIANVFAQVLDAQVKTPQEVDPDELLEYDLIGFGSGIYGAEHHKHLLDLADGLPQVTDRKAFIFSTSSNLEPLSKNHSSLREKLRSRGYVIVDEFTCAGFNTNSFMRYLGGMNKGRPNAEDLMHAKEFAHKMRRATTLGR